MAFFNTAFVFFIPIIFFLFLFKKKVNQVYLTNILSVVNILQIIYSVLLVKQLYSFYQLSVIMGFDVFPDIFYPITWQLIRVTLIILLPLLFIIKKLLANKVLSGIILLLIISDYLQELITPSTATFKFSLITFSTHNFGLNSINYVSWFVFVFSLFWFLKRLPSQSKFNK